MPDLLSLDLDDFTVVVDDSDDNDLLVGPASAVVGRLPDFDPLDEAEEAQSPSWWRLILQEGVRDALKAGLKAWLVKKQPRWPAGTPGKGGEFMETGQRLILPLTTRFSAPPGAWVRALPVAQTAPGSGDIGVSYEDAPGLPIDGFPSAWWTVWVRGREARA